MPDNLTDLILSLTPDDGSSIGNGAMLKLIQERRPEVTLDDYIAARDELLDDEELGRGRGRGGSIYKIIHELEDDDTEDDDGGELEADEEGDDEGFELAPTEEPETRQPIAASKKKGARKPDRPVQVISYRHGETRVNNPEVRMVHAGTDPDGDKTTWGYDPHLDPVLNFDTARGGDRDADRRCTC